MESLIPHSNRREFWAKVTVAAGIIGVAAFGCSHTRYESNNLGPARTASNCIEENYPSRPGVAITLPAECDTPLVDDLLRAPDPNREIYTARNSRERNELRNGILSRRDAVKRAGANEEKVRDNRGEYQFKFIGKTLLVGAVMLLVSAGARSAIFDRKPPLPKWSPSTLE